MNPQDLAAFNQAVSLASAGNKREAYQMLVALQSRYPSDNNVLLWLAFTSPNLAESGRAIAEAEKLAPNDPTILSAKVWLVASQKIDQEPTAPPATKRVNPLYLLGVVIVVIALLVAWALVTKPFTPLTQRVVDSVQDAGLNLANVKPLNSQATNAMKTLLTKGDFKAVEFYMAAADGDGVIIVCNDSDDYAKVRDFYQSSAKATGKLAQLYTRDSDKLIFWVGGTLGPVNTSKLQAALAKV